MDQIGKRCPKQGFHLRRGYIQSLGKEDSFGLQFARN